MSNLRGIRHRLQAWITNVEGGPDLTIGDILVVISNTANTRIGRLSAFGVPAGSVLIKDPAAPYGLRWAAGSAVAGGGGGVPGLDGNDGQDGMPGPPGVAGAAGAPGSTGATGPPGVPGINGDDGSDGAAGPPGQPGVAGAAGAAGAAGPPGFGFDGNDGEQGDHGIPGAPGAAGAAGSTGLTGPMGPPGLDGPEGPEGPMGPIGLTGPPGAAGGGGGGTTGTGTIDFGAFPGASDASLVITGQAAIVSGSIVQAWLRPAATADHTSDEHLVETIRIEVTDIVAGTGFTIRAMNTSQINERLESPGSSRFKGTAAAIFGGNYESVGGQGTRLYGTWSVQWRWS